MSRGQYLYVHPWQALVSHPAPHRMTIRAYPKTITRMIDHEPHDRGDDILAGFMADGVRLVCLRVGGHGVVCRWRQSDHSSWASLITQSSSTTPATTTRPMAGPK